ncbi:MAG: clostripain-related cysteine peptidase [Chloroflexota bacterium]
MKTKVGFRFTLLAAFLIIGLIVQLGAAKPVEAGAGQKSAYQAGGELVEVTATLGEPAELNLQPKPDSHRTQDPSREPDLTLPPAPPDPDKGPVDEERATREDRGWWTIMTETFEGIWPSTGWMALDGDGATNGEYYWDDDDFKPHTDYWSAWPANGGANALDPASNNYPNYMNSWMVYGPFDLSGCAYADYDFYYWNKSESGYDSFQWLASPNGSNFYGWGISGDSGGWQFVDMDLGPYLGDTSVWLAFRFVSDSSVTDIGAFVDDVRLWCYTQTTINSWTFMVYLDGDNNLESAAVNDFMEMSAVGSDANVKILVEMDRIDGYDTSYDNWTDTRRYYITAGLTPTAANGTSVGEANMGHPETLLNFVRWAKAFAPANHYVLVLWDHGSGWRLRDPNEVLTKGVAFDDSSGGDSIDMPELRSTLSTLTNGGASPFDIVGMDACLMAMAEVDNQIRPYAGIRVGSEETEPNDGWPYDTILSSLKATPSMSASTLATDIVDFYYSSYGNDHTQSAVNLGSPYATLNTAVNNFAVALMNNGHNYIAQIQAARNDSTEFSYTYYIDLWDFADWVRINVPDPAINSAALAVENAVLNAVIHEHHGPAWPWARGISIYFPKTAGEYDARYDGSSGFLQFTANTQWDEWIRRYHQFANYPAMFAKSAPANGATGLSLNPTLSWAASSGATSYAYCIDTTNDGACGGSWVSTGSNTSVTVGLGEATTYYWQVRATNASGTVYANNGGWWSFTTGSLPANFNKTGPANGAANQSLSPTLTWQASSGAASYEYCYDTTNDNSCSGWTNNGASTSKTLSGLSEYTTYYWHVRALNSIGTRYSNGSSTAFWSFTTGGLPGVFNKTGPSNGATNQPLSLTLTWGTSSNVSNYEYCYDTTNDNACSGWTNNGTSTSKTLSGLSQYTTYYWHVRANNSFGTRYSNGSSTAFWSFTTGGVPGAFNKSSPSNGASNQPTSLTLAWGSSSNAASYEYCYDTTNDNSCGGWTNNGSSTSVSVSGLNLATTYYWHVRAVNSFGTTYSNGNAWWSFTTGDIPGAFNKTNPANGEVNQPTSLTLSWNASSGVSSYEYCYDTSNNSACDGSWVNNGTSTSVPVSGLSLGTTYYWHVRAVNSFGTRYSNANTWWSFTTGNVPGAFNKSSPANGAADQPTSLTLSWNASSGATGYSYCYDTVNNNTCDGSWVNAGTNTSAAISGLTSPTTYYWHVKAANTFGETQSNGGSWWNFTTANTAPHFTSTPVLAATVGSAYTYNVTASDPDGDPLSITAPTLPSWLTLTDHGNGTATLTGTPSTADLGANPVTLEADDGINPPTPQSFTINVASAPPLKKTFKSTGSQDGWVLESTEFSNIGGTLNATATTFNLGDDAKDRQYRAILSFNTAGLPDNATIKKVTLKIKKQGLVGTNPFSTHQYILIDIRKGTFGTAALQKTDFQAAASRNQVGKFLNSPVANWFSSVLNNIAFPYINKTGITQFRLRFKLDDNNDNGADYLKFFSGNALAAYRPQLIIEYIVP